MINSKMLQGASWLLPWVAITLSFLLGDSLSQSDGKLQWLITLSIEK